MEESRLLQYFSGQLTDEECQEVEEWAEESKENRKLLEQVYCTAALIRRVCTYDAAHEEKALAQFRRDLAFKRRFGAANQISLWTRYGRWIAAFLTGVVVATGLFWTISSRSNPYEVVTAGGQRAEVLLPDGSKVWLNASTQLTYRSSWTGKRKVTMNGEAYFEVKHNELRPFEVTSSKEVSTRVLGTKFNVRAREAEKRVSTTLFEGSVQIHRAVTDKVGYRLKPGQTMVVDTETGGMELITYQHPEEVLCWIKGKMHFNDSPLEQIAELISKVYGVNVTFQNESLKEERFTGVFKTDDPIEDLLNTLALTNHFSFSISGNRVTILPPEKK